MSDVVVKARVTITVEMDLPDTWAESVDFAQVRKQANDSVRQQLRLGLAVDGLVSGLSSTENTHKLEARVVGTPSVVALLISNKEPR